MYQCKFFEHFDLDYLELRINTWLDDMKNTPMYDVHFHYDYAVRKNEHTVLVTYRLEDDDR